MKYDLIIRDARTLTSADETLDIGITQGVFAEIEATITDDASEEIEAEGMLVLPAAIDAHVHFNEPGRTQWEGISSGSAALAVGGGTVFFDMPLNSTPPTITRGDFEKKRSIAEQKSHTDFALWGALLPTNLDELAGIAESGAVGFKAFMSHSGFDEFPRADEQTLRDGMARAAELNLPVAVHAENEKLTNELATLAQQNDATTMLDYLHSRPIAAELEAITTAIACAKETGCRLHIVHVSSPAGIDLITAAKQNGIDISAETCPHYLLLDEAAAIRIGANAKCAPPLRPAETVAGMWEKIAADEIDTIGSDHSPSPAEEKKGDNFFQIWGGIASIQHAYPLLLSHCFTAPDASAELAQKAINCYSHNVAQRFNICNKGATVIGYDADFIIYDKNAPAEKIDASKLITAHPITAYDGVECTGKITSTYLRGKKIAAAGAVIPPPKVAF